MIRSIQLASKKTIGVVVALLHSTIIAASTLPSDFNELPDDVQAMMLDMAFDISRVKRVWKDDTKFSDKTTYVRYLDDYLSRTLVNHEDQTVRVEVLPGSEPHQQLRQAIVTTLLAPSNPDDKTIFVLRGESKSGTPFLYKKVKDHTGEYIRYRWRAGKFAEYLIANKAEWVNRSGQQVLRVDIPMVANFKKQQALGLEESILNASFKYDINPSLIYGIIETESSFNPFAVSHANAYGLMQVVPTTAGRDVFQKRFGRKGQPSPNTLFTPSENIEIGSAYLNILSQDYLKGITDPVKKEYCIISAYNGGAGNVLKTFHRNRRQAVKEINRLSRGDVYRYLTEYHPREESRNYLKKVMRYKKRYE